MKHERWIQFRKDVGIAVSFVRQAHEIKRSYLPLLIFNALVQSVSPFLNMILPKYILDELLGGQRIPYFVLYVLLLIIGNALFSLFSRFLQYRVTLAEPEIINGFKLRLGEKIMRMPYENLEDPEILDKKEQALFTINNQDSLNTILNCLVNNIRIVVTLAGLVTLIATLNVLLLLVIAGIVALNMLIYQKMQQVQFMYRQGLIPLNRKFSYYSRLAGDFSMGKDVRLYNMSPFIMKKVEGFNDESLNGMGKLFGISGKYEGWSAVVLQIQMIVVYAYMVWRVVEGAISIGSFTMYISAANSFAQNVSDFVKNFIEFRQACRYLDLYLQFFSIAEQGDMEQQSLAIPEDVTIEFRNVWFKYPRSDKYVLENVSLCIHNREKLSIVGENGAGKTTFIKLLCRLYQPEKGEILLNGVNIQEYVYSDYVRLLSVVFQDYKLLSFSIQQNLSFYEEANAEKMETALKKAGLWEKIQTLPYGLGTNLYRNFHEDGIELSGGEMQKLAIARAIYKEAPIVILDEPTAALDPYAEYEVYSRLNQLVENKTTIYISHRLSSCRFCHHIAVFSKGKIVEYGSHEELLEMDGLYAQMWTTQAQYYN